MFIIVMMVPVVESVTLIIAESVVFHHITHPLEVSDEHLLYIHIIMRPITRTVPVCSVIVVTGRFTITFTRIRVFIHLIVLAYI